MLGRNIDDYLNADGLFRKTLESGKDIVDEDMVFSFRGNELKCEVLTTHLAGDARGGGGGLVIKLRNAKYVQKYKPSKNKMKARFKFDHIQGTSNELKEAVRLGKIASRQHVQCTAAGRKRNRKRAGSLRQSIATVSARKALLWQLTAGQ